MRIGYIVVAVLAIIGCCFCYWIGYRKGTKESIAQEERRGNLFLALRLYQTMERTNYNKVERTLGGQVFALTRDYEQRYGIPIGTNRFVQHFAEAKAVADRFASQLVPLEAAFKNLPLAPNLKVGVEKKD